MDPGPQHRRGRLAECPGHEREALIPLFLHPQQAAQFQHDPGPVLACGQRGQGPFQLAPRARRVAGEVAPFGKLGLPADQGGRVLWRGEVAGQFLEFHCHVGGAMGRCGRGRLVQSGRGGLVGAVGRQSQMAGPLLRACGPLREVAVQPAAAGLWERGVQR